MISILSLPGPPMAAIAVPGRPFSLNRHRIFPSRTSATAAVSGRLSSARIRCERLPSPSFPSAQNPKPLKLQAPKPTFSLTKTLSIAAATAGLVFFISSSIPSFSNPFSGGNGNRGGGGSGGGGGGGGWCGGFWPWLLPPPAIADDDHDGEWDSHGLPANIVVQLNKLSGFKKYMVSDIEFFDRRRRETIGSDDSFFEMVSLCPGGVYTKTQLQKELETLAGCGMFEKVDLEGKTRPDGTVGVKISFVESTWQSADKFKCINVGLIQPSNPIEMDADMTEKEKLEYFRSQEKEYRRRIERARPCILPMPVQREALHILRERGKVSARLLQKIRDKVQKWYHDEGYVCAHVVNFGNLNTKEVVCEVVEGDITQLVIQFQDKLGNVCEGNTQLGVIRRELPKQVMDLYLL